MANIYKTLRESYKPSGETLSIRKFAPVIGITYTHISDIEAGKRPPSPNELKKYHLFFKVSYEYLLGETPYPVNGDVFRAKSLIESDVENTIRCLSASKHPAEKDLWNIIVKLLATPSGYAFLYYLSQVISGRQLPLNQLANMLFSGDYDNMSYAEIRAHLDPFLE